MPIATAVVAATAAPAPDLKAAMAGPGPAGQTAVVGAMGTITLAADGNYTFTPAANWNGDLPQVSYTTNTAAVATLDIRVTAVDDASVLRARPAGAYLPAWGPPPSSACPTPRAQDQCPGGTPAGLRQPGSYFALPGRYCDRLCTYPARREYCEHPVTHRHEPA